MIENLKVLKDVESISFKWSKIICGNFTKKRLILLVFENPENFAYAKMWKKMKKVPKI